MISITKIRSGEKRMKFIAAVIFSLSVLIAAQGFGCRGKRRGEELLFQLICTLKGAWAMKVFVNPGHDPNVDSGAVNIDYDVREADVHQTGRSFAGTRFKKSGA